MGWLAIFLFLKQGVIMDSPTIDQLLEQESDVPLILIEPSRGWIRINFWKLWNYCELLLFLTWRDIKVWNKQTILGAS